MDGDRVAISLVNSHTAKRFEQGSGIMEYEVFVIGGGDDEKVSIIQAQVGRGCRLSCEVRGETHYAEESDFFEALRTIRRRALEPLGLIPFCYGASLKVWPSGMARDMGQGLQAYKIEIGSQATNLVDIFASGADVIPSPVDAQEQYARDWIASLRPPSPPSSNGTSKWRHQLRAMLKR